MTARRLAFAGFAALSQQARWRMVLALDPETRRDLFYDWSGWSHAGQDFPEGDWRVWLLRAGRGFGKTRTGAEWISAVARATPKARIALVGATVSDVRSVMIEGPSGLIAVARDTENLLWRSTAGEIEFPSGAKAYVYSAEAPEKLRGPEHNAAWCDEVAKWRYGDAAWDNLLLGLRAGEHPQVVVTTTPKPIALMHRIATMQGLIVTAGATRDNPHLPESAVAAMEEQYGGTRLGRQELGGELIEDIEHALWKRAVIEACRVAAAPDLVRVLVAVDPPAGTDGDACGIVAVGLGADDVAYVIEDASVAGRTPEGWARAVAECAARVGADRVVAEKNQGGEMVRDVLMRADGGLPLRLVHASRGKTARAEPVSACYERGEVRHVGAFPALEDELCGLIAGGGYQGPGRSPDRADALVWAVTELLLGTKREVQVRVIGDGPVSVSNLG